jgi:hypothetical protein
MKDEKQRRRELEIIEYLRQQEELTAAQADQAQGGGYNLTNAWPSKVGLNPSPVTGDWDGDGDVLR